MSMCLDLGPLGLYKEIYNARARVPRLREYRLSDTSWSSCQMPLTARQLRQPPTIEAIGRVPYFADVVELT